VWVQHGDAYVNRQNCRYTAVARIAGGAESP